jgi:hypothetical protein
MLTRTEKRRSDAILREWLFENDFTTLDAFLDCYEIIKVTNPEILEDLLDRLRQSKTPVTAE